MGATATDSSARGTASRLPKAVCWNLSGEHHAAKRRPRFCGLYPPSPPPYGLYMMRVRWSKWGGREAIGRGAAYRMWSDTRVRLFAPKRRCGRRVFTRARFRYVGSSQRGIFKPFTVSLACR